MLCDLLSPRMAAGQVDLEKSCQCLKYGNRGFLLNPGARHAFKTWCAGCEGVNVPLPNELVVTVELHYIFPLSNDRSSFALH